MNKRPGVVWRLIPVFKLQGIPQAETRFAKESSTSTIDVIIKHFLFQSDRYKTIFLFDMLIGFVSEFKVIIKRANMADLWQFKKNLKSCGIF